MDLSLYLMLPEHPTYEAIYSIGGKGLLVSHIFIQNAIFSNAAFSVQKKKKVSVKKISIGSLF